MNNKEWIQRVLDRTDDTPVPYNLSLSPVAQRRLEEFYQTKDIEGFLDLPIRMTGTQSIKPLYASPDEFGSHATDEFGVVWTTNEIDRGAPAGPCITEPSLSGYRFPDPAAEYRFEHLGQWCARNAEHYRIVWVGDLWERATFMCDMEKLLLYVALEPEFVESLLTGIADYILRTMEILFDRFEFDCVAISDDYGTQESLLISPEAWRRLVKPRLADIFSKAKSADKTVFLHSCGNVRAVVPDLIELGLDILHPIQPETMDVLELKSQFGDQLTFCGGLGTQDLLVNGSTDDVHNEVQRLKQQLGHNGGYILETGITIQADVPLENIVAMIETARNRRH